MSIFHNPQAFQDMATRILAGWYLLYTYGCIPALISFGEGIYWDKTLTIRPSISIQKMRRALSTRCVAVGTQCTFLIRHFIDFLMWCMVLPACQRPRRSRQVNIRLGISLSTGLNFLCPNSIIRTIGAASTVLLKNKGQTLPLKAPKSIAIIGDNCK